MKRYRPGSYQNERLLKALTHRTDVQIQNGLMRSSDREIALAFQRMDQANVDSLLAKLPEQKARRVREEIAYQKRLRITEDQYERMIDLIIASVSGGRTAAPTRSYIRPRKDRRS